MTFLSNFSQSKLSLVGCTVALSLIVASALSACKSERPKRIHFSSLKGGESREALDEQYPNEGASIPLELKPNAGSQMRFLNGNALTRVYGRIFKPDEWGYAHCEKDKPTDFNGCKVIFAAEERPSVSFFDLYSQRMARGIQNVATTESLTLNYLRNLRAALGRECNRLVEKEEKLLESGASESTILVKKSGPTEQSLDVFFRRLLDVEGTNLDLGMPFAEYISAYEKAISLDEDKARAQHNSYVNLCITLAMDPQVFLY